MDGLKCEIIINSTLGKALGMNNNACVYVGTYVCIHINVYDSS